MEQTFKSNITEVLNKCIQTQQQINPERHRAIDKNGQQTVKIFG